MAFALRLRAVRYRADVRKRRQEVRQEKEKPEPPAVSARVKGKAAKKVAARFEALEKDAVRRLFGAVSRRFELQIGVVFAPFEAVSALLRSHF